MPGGMELLDRARCLGLFNLASTEIERGWRDGVSFKQSVLVWCDPLPCDLSKGVTPLTSKNGRLVRTPLVLATTSQFASISTKNLVLLLQIYP